MNSEWIWIGDPDLFRRLFGPGPETKFHVPKPLHIPFASPDVRWKDFKMSTRNDITGDELTSRATNEKYREGWDRIFGHKTERVRNSDTTKCPHCKEEHAVVNGSCMYCNKVS